MADSLESLDIDLSIRKSPDAVRAWWTDIPDDYTATDPREEPFRIVTLRKFPNGWLLLTYWRDDDGSVRERHEVLLVLPDGSWTVDMTDSPHFHFHDEFRVTPAEGGTNLHIHQTYTPRDPSYASLIPELKKDIAQMFKAAAEICERDAP